MISQPPHHRKFNLIICMAVSMDTCTAVARFLSWVWRHTHTRVVYPGVLAKPVPIPVETYTLGHRYRFSGVWVQVDLENPRVSTYANLYLYFGI